jgi:hypothetical protein
MIFTFFQEFPPFPLLRCFIPPFLGDTCPAGFRSALYAIVRVNWQEKTY